VGGGNDASSYSVAFGGGAHADNYGFALGGGCYASQNAIALGNGSHAENNSLSFGGGGAYDNSISLGRGNFASAYSVTIGDGGNSASVIFYNWSTFVLRRFFLISLSARSSSSIYFSIFFSFSFIVSSEKCFLIVKSFTFELQTGCPFSKTEKL
jgi:hypothetical protein